MPDFAFAFIDCEFGGLDPEQHDITEVALIVTDYRLAELASGEWKIRARAHRITPEAAAISGYRAEDWEGAPHLREVLAELDALLPSGKTIVPAGQNHGFRNIGSATLHVHAVLASPVFEAMFDGVAEPVRRWLPAAADSH